MTLVRLGFWENLAQFSLLVVVNAKLPVKTRVVTRIDAAVAEHA